MAKGESDAVNKWSYFLIPLMHLLTIPLCVHRCLPFRRMTFLEPNAKLLVNITICYSAGLLSFLLWGRWFLHRFLCFPLFPWVSYCPCGSTRMSGSHQGLRGAPRSSSAALPRGSCVLPQGNWLVFFLSLSQI